MQRPVAKKCERRELTPRFALLPVSLRWHYPVQVLRVDSQPGIPSAPNGYDVKSIDDKLRKVKKVFFTTESQRKS